MNSLKSLKKDNNGNLLLIGTPEIKIPEKMFFMAKNGQVKEAPTTTKTGALSMRGGVRSVNLIPEDNKVEIVKLGETLEEFRKRQSKKEVEDLLKQVNETKINKKINMDKMPELPEPKKENKVSNLIDDYLKVKDYVGLLNNKTINFNDKMKVLKDLSFKELQNLTFHKLSEFVKFKDLKFGDICLVYLINKKALAYCVKKTAKTATFERIKFLEHDFIKSNEFNVDGIRDWGRDENYYYIDKPSVYSNKVYTIRFSEDDGLYVYNNPCVIRMIGETHKTY